MSLSLTACGLTSPVRGLDFKEPSGWTSTPGSGFMQTWFTSRAGRTDTDLFIVSRRKERNDERQVSSKAVTICGDHLAWYLETRRQRPETEEILESVTTSWDGIVYKALYIRLSNEPRDPAAEAAMRSLCKWKSS